MLLIIVFFFRQKTAYEMRISDWSSDVCSSDLGTAQAADHRCGGAAFPAAGLCRDRAGRAGRGERITQGFDVSLLPRRQAVDRHRRGGRGGPTRRERKTAV